MIITGIRITKHGVAGDVSVYAILSTDASYPVATSITIDVAICKSISTRTIAVDSFPFNAEGNNGILKCGVRFIIK